MCTSRHQHVHMLRPCPSLRAMPLAPCQPWPSRHRGPGNVEDLGPATTTPMTLCVLQSGYLKPPGGLPSQTDWWLASQTPRLRNGFCFYGNDLVPQAQ